MKIFLSYTADDLKMHADAVSRIIQRLEWIPVDHRYWAASGRPSVQECKQQVELSDALVVLVAHRYGWVPTREDGGDGEKSITWIEVDWAKAHEIPVIPFLLDEDAPWPPRMIEGLRDITASERLSRFKAELKKAFCGFFSEDPRSIEGPIAIALQKRLAARPIRASKPEDHLDLSRTRADRGVLYERAFSILFEECLNLQPDDEVVVIYDGSANPYLPAIFQASRSLHSAIMFIWYPKFQQLDSEDEGCLRAGIRSAIAHASALITVLDDDPLTTRARLTLLKYAALQGKRVLHAPGLDSEVLEVLAMSNLERLNRVASVISSTVSRSGELRIITRSVTGARFELSIALSTPVRTQVYVPKRISPNQFSNVSLGVVEVYPADTAASGSICINKSGPGYIARPGEEAILSFEAGRLSIPENPQTGLQSQIVELLRLVSRGEVNSWNALTEISIGLNQAIREESRGSSITKSSEGIVGIGIGNNIVHGGEIDAPFYWDFTCTGASVWAGDIQLVEQGKIVVHI